MKKILTNLLLISLVFSLHNTFSQESKSSTEVEILIDSLISKVGGKEVWKNAKGFNMLEVAYLSQYKRPLVREFWIDFEKPRIKMITRGADSNSTNILNINQGFTENSSGVSVWDQKRVNALNTFWMGIPTRIFHLIAKNDQSLSYQINQDRIDFFINNSFVVWIATSPDGTPVAYGRNNNHEDTHFLGEILNYGSTRLWKKAYEPGDMWHVTLADYILLKDLSKINFKPD